MAGVDFVDVNGLGGGFALGFARAGNRMVGRTGYLGLGQKLVADNAPLYDGGEGAWHDGLGKDPDPEAWWRPSSDVPLMVAVPPCSGFSGLTGLGAAHGRVERGHVDHASNDCMWRTIRYAGIIKPRVIVFESVWQAYTKGRSLMQALRAELELVSGLRYNLTHVLHDGLALGSPAQRKRYLFVATLEEDGPVAVKVGEGAEVDRATTVGQALGDLAFQPQERGLHPYTMPATSVYQTRARASGGARISAVDGTWFDATSGWCERTSEALSAAAWMRGRGMDVWWPQGKDLTWMLRQLEGIERQNEALGDEGDAALEGLVNSICGEAAEKMRGKEFEMGAFQIMRWKNNLPGRVISGGGPMYTVHPTEDRNLNHRELARLMGYPDEFRIDLTPRHPALTATWGKNVSPIVGEWAAGWLMKHLEEADDHAGDPQYLEEIAVTNRTQIVNGVTTVEERGWDYGTILEDGDREVLVDRLDVGRRLRREALARAKTADLAADAVHATSAIA